MSTPHPSTPRSKHLTLGRCLLVVALWLLVPASAFASIPCADLSVAKKTEYKELVSSGHKLGKEGKYTDAIGSYKKAQGICPYDPVLTYSLARAHHLNNDCDAARALYQQTNTSLASGLIETSLTIAKIESRLKELNKTCKSAPVDTNTDATLRVTCMNDGVQLTVDGGEAKACPLSDTLSPGSHNIVASLDGHQPHNIQVVLGERETSSIQIPTLKAGSSQPLPPPPPPKSGVSGLELGGWIAVGSGAAILSTGVALHFVAESDRATVEDATATNGIITGLTRQEALTIQDDANTLDTVGAILMGVGGAALAAGVVMIVLEYTGTDEDTSSASAFYPLALPGGGGMGWTLTY